MRMTFAQAGDSLIFVGDLLNFHRDPLDKIFEQVFRACVRSVNLQHFNRNEVVADDYAQFTLEHTDFVDYVFSSQNVKYEDLQYPVLVGGVINWSSNLAQSNRQMNVDNDWAISLQVLRLSEIPRGFGKRGEHGLQSKVKLNVREKDSARSPVFDPDVVMDVQTLMADEEHELFGEVSDDDSCSASSEGDEYNDDAGTLNSFTKPLHNESALTLFVNDEVCNSK